MATIGRSSAVAWIGRFHFSGFFAWLTWLFVHLVFLLGFHNKLVVRGARIITGLAREPVRPAELQIYKEEETQRVDYVKRR